MSTLINLEIKIVVVGATNCGKSALIKNYIFGDYSEDDFHVSFDFKAIHRTLSIIYNF